MQIWDSIKNREYISFDIFDTLIKRNVPEPRALFSIVAFWYLKQYGLELFDFPAKRKAAEKAARERSSKEEITFQEIYDLIDYPQEISERLIKLEVDAELQFCQKNYDIIGLFERCISERKKVILISDMYLPEAVIAKILENNGIVGYQRLFLSSSIGLQKGTGNLYKYVLNDLGIKPSDIVHIGDGYVTDFYRPFQAGIRGIHIIRNKRNTRYVGKKLIFNNGLNIWPFVNNNLEKYRNQTELFRLGYETLGPLILGFLLWIHKKIEKCKTGRAFFLARDMYLFVDIYNKIFPDSDIKYLEVSRRSLRKAYVLATKNLKSVLNTIGRREYFISEICEMLNIDFEEIMNECGVYNVTEKTSFNEIIKNNQLYEKIQYIVLDQLKKQTDLVIDYLRQQCVFDNDYMVIVDIGWHGTIQNMIEGITKQKIKGLYLGNTRRKDYKRMASEGYWFDSDDEMKTLNNMSIVGILEAMLFPNLGTTIGYKDENGDIKPVYRDSEAVQYDKIREFQDGALTFLRDILVFIKNGKYGIAMLDAFDMTAGTCMTAYINMAYRPELEDAKILGELDYEDNNIMKLAKPGSHFYYILHPKQLLHDYANCKWKVGFIKQLWPIFCRPDLIDKVIKKRYR